MSDMVQVAESFRDAAAKALHVLRPCEHDGHTALSCVSCGATGVILESSLDADIWRLSRRLEEVAEEIEAEGYVKVVSEEGIHEWLAKGRDAGWISEGFCLMHDMSPMTPEEADSFEDGLDPCMPGVRLYPPL